MTNEEAIKIIKAECYVFNPLNLDRTQMVNTALDRACKALEQEPCEDAISRQNAIFLANDLKEDLPDDEHIANMVLAHNEGILEYQTKLSLLQPVTPQTKTGHWIEEVNDYGEVMCWHCDKCYEDSGFATDCQWDYCPICGAKMEEVEE